MWGQRQQLQQPAQNRALLEDLRRVVFETQKALQRPAAMAARLSTEDSYRHVCTGQTCPLVSVRDVYVCLLSLNVHFCTPQMCQRVKQTLDGDICDLTGVCHRGYDDPLLVGDSFASFGGQQRLERSATDNTIAGTYDDDMDMLEDEIAAAVEPSAAAVDIVAHAPGPVPIQEALIELEVHKSMPEACMREREAKRAEMEVAHNKRMSQALHLLDLLLFSERRKQLNEICAQQSAQRTRSTIKKYCKHESVQFFEHIWRIMGCDEREAQWCQSMPQRNSPAEEQGRKACEGACIWWNRFEEAQLTSQYRFEYHVMAVIYIYAAGLRDLHVQVIPAHTALAKALPNRNRLDSFDGVVSSTFTTHDRLFREYVHMWRRIQHTTT